MKNAALVLAGGVGSRMNMGSFPKQYLTVDDRPVLDYCLCTFQKTDDVDAIVIVADSSWHDFINGWLEKSRMIPTLNTKMPAIAVIVHLRYDSVEVPSDFFLS